MRAYGVLADIYQQRGNEKQETFFRGVLKAIRLAENADDFYDAGLKTRAVAMYEDALLQFADAYCIESRLAVQLANLGNLEAAAKHYQRAFELMPDSFGQVESHCFGCEQAFQGNLAQTTAEEVFTRLAKENPTKPQIFYLIGYLRDSQYRYPEALAAYQKAVQLDPDYLNAWSKILDIHEHMHLPREVREEAILNALRLDPLGNHSYYSTSQGTNLAELWETYVKHRPETLEIPREIYPLQASSKQIAQQKQALQEASLSGGQFMDVHWQFSHLDESSEVETPGELIANNDIISNLCELFDQLQQTE